ncbi:MAG: hypothetical protein M1815_000913 [Lichina confinis]|nr:MAG: hypothetical protein M1815_000913 [Lichina confinis]
MALIKPSTGSKVASSLRCKAAAKSNEKPNLQQSRGWTSNAPRTGRNAPVSPQTTDFLRQRIAKIGVAEGDMKNRVGLLENWEANERATRLEKFQHRRWRAGDVYAPHDLSSVAMKHARHRSGPRADVFDLLGINPLNEYKNFAMMAEFTSTMGRIKHSQSTGLRPVNQRRIAKAIRRAVGIGLMPRVYHHPELLEYAALRNPDKRVT